MFPSQNNRPLPAHLPLYFDDFITRNNWMKGQQEMPFQLSPMPATNVYETEKALHIELVVPGLSHEDLVFFTTEDTIEVRYAPDDHGFEVLGSRRNLHQEYRPVAFRRVFQINPEALDLDGLSVASGHGIVRVDIPKREEFQGALPLRMPFSLN